MPKLIRGVGGKPKRSIKKKALIVCAIGVVLLAGALTLYNLLAARPAGSGDSPVIDAPARTQAATDAISKAQGRVDLGDTGGAVAILDSAVTKSKSVSDKIELITVKGTILANNGQTDQGADALRQAISLSPSDPLLYKTLGSIYEVAEQKDNAISAYKEGIANVADGPKKQAQINELNGAIRRAENNE